MAKVRKFRIMPLPLALPCRGNNMAAYKVTMAVQLPWARWEEADAVSRCVPARARCYTCAATQKQRRKADVFFSPWLTFV